MTIRPAHATDFYKTGHIRQYPDKTQLVYSNGTFRSAKHAAKIVLPDFDNKIVWFGLQGALLNLNDDWYTHFFDLPKDIVVNAYRDRMDSSLGKGSVNVDHIAALHDLGYLPIRIKALPEGSRVPIRVPCFTITNTLDDFYWITNYLETPISASLWKSVNSATIAYEYRRLFDRYADMTGSPKEFVPWQGHDFSARGLDHVYVQATSGAGHLLSFTGTDTILGIDYLEDYYLSGTKGLIGGSVPATEHSVMCMGGQEDEIETFRRLIQDIYPEGIVSIVSDTWDFWQVITEYSVQLKDKIMARNGKVVFRPDSGNPADIICGDPSATPGTPEYKGAIECLWEVFGGTTTSTGHKLLDSHVGLIYGDSITLEIAQEILHRLDAKGFASANVVLGIGSFTYQYNTRDTFGFAIKSTYGIVNNEPREIFKQPKTDSGMKNSACGLVRVEEENGTFVLYDRQTPEQEKQGALKLIYENGNFVKLQSYQDVRRRLGTFQ